MTSVMIGLFFVLFVLVLIVPEIFILLLGFFIFLFRNYWLFFRFFLFFLSRNFFRFFFRSFRFLGRYRLYSFFWLLRLNRLRWFNRFKFWLKRVYFGN